MKVKSSLLNESLETLLAVALELPGLGDMAANLPRGTPRPLELSQLPGRGPEDARVFAQAADDLLTFPAKAKFEIGVLAANVARHEALPAQLLILIRW